jgi:hypothetical protein
MTIVCMTPNPATDRTLNVARAIRTLGDDLLCLRPLSGLLASAAACRQTCLLQI